MPIHLDVLPRLGLREAEAAVAQAKLIFAGAGKDAGEAFSRSAESSMAAARVLNTVGIASVVAFTAAVAESAKAAGNFQASQMRLVASAGESAANLKIVSDGILQLAGQVGYTADELSKGMYTVEKAGFRGADAIKVMTAAAQGAKSENADLTEVNNGLTTSMNDFHIPAANAADVMSKMVVATGAAKTTFQDFSGSLHSVEPAAAAAGIKLEDIYAVLARVTQSGASAQQTTENMRNAINSLSAPTSVMRDNMAKFGISADDVSQHLGDRGLSGSLQLISDQIRSHMSPAQQAVVSDMYANAQATKDATQMIKDMSPAAAKLATELQNGEITHKDFAKATRGSTQDDYAKLAAFGSLENKLESYSSNLKKGQDTVETYNRAMKDATGTVAAQTIALQVTGENAKATNDLVKQLTNTTREHDGTVKGFNETQQTLNAKLADAKAGFGAAAIQLGNVFIPALTTAAGALSNVAAFLEEHKTLAKDAALAVGAIGAAWLITKSYMVFENIIAGLGRMATAMFGVKTETLAVNTALRAQGPAAVTAAGEVEGAAASEKTALAGVATSALRLTGIVTTLGFLIKDLWGNDISKWAHDNIPGVDANGMIGFNLTGAPRPQGSGGGGGTPGAPGVPAAVGQGPGNVLGPLGPGLTGGSTPGQGSGQNPLGVFAPTGGGSAAPASFGGGNEAIVHQAMVSAGWGEDQWPALRNLMMHESGFSNTAANPSGAYGMFQFMPYTWGTYGTGGRTSDPSLQAQYGMQYIAGRYGSPSAAWAQYFNHAGGEGSYDEGGILPPMQPGAPPMVPVNTTGQPEAVLNPQQTQMMQSFFGGLQQGGGIGGMIGGIGNMAMNAAQAGQQPSSVQPGMQPSGKGGGSSQSGAGGALGMVAGMFPGGQVASALAMRTAKFGGQLASIGIMGAMETFLPGGTTLSDPSKSLLGRVASGIAGGQPASPNMAAQAKPPQAAPPMPPPGQHTGSGAPPGPAPMVTMINPVFQNGIDGQAVGRDIAREQRSYTAGDNSR